jgi:chromosome segregation ATPase
VAEEWFTYAALGERLGIATESVRQKAMRYRWPRRTNNAGRAEVRVDVEEIAAHIERFHVRKPDNSRATTESTPVEPTSDAQTHAALDAHITTLKQMLTEARAYSEQERARADVERERNTRLQERIDELLTERAQVGDKQDAALRELERQLAELRTVLAARRPWWRRLAG